MPITLPPIALAAALALSTFALAQSRPTTGPNPTPSQIRSDFRRIIDRPAVPLDPHLRALPDHDGLAVAHLDFTSEPGQQVPALILSSKGITQQRPVVIVLHGTGQNKEDYLDLLTTLAHRGFTAIAPDGRYHGERCAAGHGTAAYYAAIGQAFIDGKSHPWLFDNVYDVSRLIDYLQTRLDIDPNRIGLIGFSKGGMECYLEAVTDPRVAVAVPCISVQSFAWELANDQWHERIKTVQGGFDIAAKSAGIPSPGPDFVQRFYDRLVPGIDAEFDCPSIVPLICPRPLLTINGEIDKLNPLPGTRLALAATAAAYEQAGVPDHFKSEIEPATAHAVKPQFRRDAVDWLVRWLKPMPPTD